MSILYNYLNYNTADEVLCRLFKAVAKDAWERIEFSRTRPHMRIHETTITQNIVYEMRQLQLIERMVNFRIKEATNEKANGNDLLLAIRQAGNRYVLYAIQCKIIYHKFTKAERGIKYTDLKDGTYPQLQHRVKKSGKTQIELLLEYSARPDIGAIPLYMFYNFVTDSRGAIRQTDCNETFGDEQLGCTIVNANTLAANFSFGDDLRKNVKFSDLHPSHAIPWAELACCFGDKDIDSTAELLKINGGQLKNVISYSQEEIDSFKGFVDLKDNTQVDRLLLSHPDTESFNPRFMLIFDSRNQRDKNIDSIL